MSIRTQDIINYMEKVSPSKYAYEWDNVGLIIGDSKQDINRIMVALDATEEVVDEAIKQNVDIIITHHPMIFKGIKRVTSADFLGRKIIKLIKNNISLFSAHTNFDAVGSLSDELAKKLELREIDFLDSSRREKLYKLVVFVPITHAEQVRTVICEKGAGHLGNYSHCTYNLIGEGTFKPLKEATPFIGEKEKLTEVKEIRIETIIKEKDLNSVLNAMFSAHPYEEVAYDIYLLQQKGDVIGIGRIGSLEENMTIREFAKIVKENLRVNSIRVYGDLDKIIKNVAVSPGKGISSIKNAIMKKVDIMVTGDIDYHTSIDALQEGLPLIDVGHFATEHIIVDYIIDLLNRKFGNKITLIRATEQRPFKTI
ncbi:MAG: Nif3-like dinuclear metal center hexameric protein [Eubacteriales bacterium]